MSLNQSLISDFSEYYRWSQRTKIKRSCLNFLSHYTFYVRYNRNIEIFKIDKYYTSHVVSLLVCILRFFAAPENYILHVTWTK